ncbi:cation diffusion facilitator [Malassezia pachydermatis]|uniref:Cation diffusion facilitator n=1 Tax=Malassezia pachydermatis TaxID=77020 RepID=A0A0M9VPB5_9BASI|nr:cation diffusion facilitator [Malassezia pachydermatis]KOS14265.1 cation diffusion facilitator [Malassezia pachydermatis]
MRRSDSIASLRAFAQIIDGRSGYFEDVRKTDDEIRAIKNADVRAFYEGQNAVLDGWREVDEVLESQFPTEIMRRFSMPYMPNLTGLIHGFESPHGLNHRSDYPHRHPEDHDDGFGTDEESDSIWSHPFSHHSMRRSRRISERALTSLSGFFGQEGNLSGSQSRVDLAAESLQDLSKSLAVNEHNKERPTLADLIEHPELTESEDDEGLMLAKHKKKFHNKHSLKESRSMLRRMLTSNPAMYSTDAQKYGAILKLDAAVVSPITKSTPKVDEVAVTIPTNRPRTDQVWTKADHERDKLLQNVPTHQRKQDTDAFVQFYININLSVNLLLVVGKVVAVYSSNSVSLLASLVDSALDLLCTVVIFMTSRASAYRSWHTFYKYPVGKRRLEPLGVLIFSVLMVVSFLQVLLESLNRIWAIYTHKPLEGDVALPLIGIFFMLLTIVVKTMMWLMCHNHKNSSVRAIAQDSENDVMFNIVSLIFPTIGDYLGWSLLDPLGGGLLSLYIISEWISTMADTTSKLTGKAADAEDASRCLYLVSRFSHVQAIAGFEMYHAGDTMVAEVDVVLPMHFKLKEAHDLGEIITYCIESLTGIERAYIHLDYNPAGQSGHIGQRG